MIGLVVLSLAVLDGQATSQVRIVPTHELSLAPKSRLTPSTDGDQAGIVLFKHPGLTNNSMLRLQNRMSYSPIICVVRKTSKRSFVTSPAFDLKAFREKVAKDSFFSDTIVVSEQGKSTRDLVGNYFDRMEEGDVVAILENTYGRPDLIFGPVSGDGEPLHGFNLLKLGSPIPGYANIPFQATLKETVGLLWHGIGSQATTDGIKFTVVNQSRIGLEAVHPFRVHIRQEGEPIGWSYEFESKWSDASSLDDSRREFLSDLKSFVKAPQHLAPQSNFAQEFIVDCGQPFKFWKGIAIHRTTHISGYYSHVKIP